MALSRGVHGCQVALSRGVHAQAAGPSDSLWAATVAVTVIRETYYGNKLLEKKKFFFKFLFPNYWKFFPTFSLHRFNIIVECIKDGQYILKHPPSY